MKTAVFSTKPYDLKFLVAANASGGHEFNFYEEKLSVHTAKLAEGHTAVCVFVNDMLNARVLDILQNQRVFPRLDSAELYKQLESSEKQIFEACAPFGAGISAGFEDVLRGCRSTDGK